MRVQDAATVQELREWFQALWNDPLTRPVDDAALALADAAWKRRRTFHRGGTVVPGTAPLPTIGLKDPQLLESALRWARETPLIEAIGTEEVAVAQAIDPATMTKSDLGHLIDSLATWYPDIGVVRGALDEPLKKVRSTFRAMTDPSSSVVERLKRELNSDDKLWGFAVPMWSTVLYWRDPENTPPLNQRSYAIAEELGRDEGFAQVPSAKTYQRWLALAEELRVAWDLPTLGHVDRVVYAYTAGRENDGPLAGGEHEPRSVDAIAGPAAVEALTSMP